MEEATSSAGGEAQDSLVNNNNNNQHSKPGRKFGLTGQRPPDSSNNGAGARKMSAREGPHSWMYSLSDQEMEDKFNAICLSIRTESLTLGQRLEHQLAERDLVEANLSQEMRGLHSLLVMLKQEVAKSQSKPYAEGLGSGALHDLFVRLAHQVEAVNNCALRISSSAESLGAVEYESRLNAAVQILLLYVDNVKRKWEKEHNELEETKRILKESGVNVAQCLANLPQPNQPAKSEGTSGPVSKRRASFPAAPFRRVSLKSPPPVASSRALQPSGEVTSEPVSSSPIEEEKEETAESVTSAGTADSSSAGAHEANQKQQVPTPPPLPPPSSSDKATVTIQRRGASGGGKRRSWTRNPSLTSNGGGADAGEHSGRNRKSSRWLLQAGQWTREVLDQASDAVVFCRQRWSSLRRKKLQLLRYSASACFLLAALVSLVLTFIPSSGSGRLPNSTRSS